MTRRLETRSVATLDAVAKLAELSSALATNQSTSPRPERAFAQALTKEQHRLAELLHGTLAQSLTAARIHARLAKKKLATNPSVSPEVLAEVERSLENAVDELQALMRWLRSPELDRAGLAQALHDLAAFASQKVPTRFVEREQDSSIDRAVELQLMRSAQLILFDVVRRGTAHAATLSLCSGAEHVVLAIDEHGTPPPSRAWDDLVEAELAALGGSFTVQRLDPSSESDVCTRVVCRLPKQL